MSAANPATEKKVSAKHLMQKAISQDIHQQKQAERIQNELHKESVRKKKEAEKLDEILKEDKGKIVKVEFPNQVATQFDVSRLPRDFMQTVLTYLEETTPVHHTKTHGRIAASPYTEMEFGNHDIRGEDDADTQYIKEMGYVPVPFTTVASEILQFEKDQARGPKQQYSHIQVGSNSKVLMSRRANGIMNFNYMGKNISYNLADGVPLISFYTIVQWKKAQAKKKQEEKTAEEAMSDNDSYGVGIIEDIDYMLDRIGTKKPRTVVNKLVKNIYEFKSMTKDEYEQRAKRKLALFEPERAFQLDSDKSCADSKKSEAMKRRQHDPRGERKGWVEHTVEVKDGNSSFCVAPYTTTGENGQQTNLAESYHPKEYHHMGAVASAYKEQEKGPGKEDIEGTRMDQAYDDMAFCASGSDAMNSSYCNDSADMETPLRLGKKTRKSACNYEDKSGICKPHWMQNKDSALYKLYHNPTNNFILTEKRLGKEALRHEQMNRGIDFEAGNSKKSKSTRWNASVASAKLEKRLQDAKSLVRGMEGGSNSRKPMIRRR